MLEIHNFNKQSANEEKSSNRRPSFLWLLLAGAIFAIFIFSILYCLLRVRFLYVPILSHQFGGEVYPEYQLPSELEVLPDLTLQDWNLKDGFSILTLSEKKVTLYFRKYLDPSWQIIFFKNGFEIFGNLYSSVNNSNYWSEVKINYEEGALYINLNGINIPRQLNNYLLNYMISSDEEAESEKYFDKVEFDDNQVSVYFSKDQWGSIMKDFNSEDFFQSLIKFLIYSN